MGGTAVAEDLHFLQQLGRGSDTSAAQICVRHPALRKGKSPYHYKAIPLLTIARKILARVQLLNQLISQIEQDLLPESQCGFRVGHSTIDMMLADCRRNAKSSTEAETQQCVNYLSRACFIKRRTYLWMTLHFKLPIHSIIWKHPLQKHWYGNHWRISKANSVFRGLRNSDSDSDYLYLAHWPFKINMYRCIHK